MNAIQNLYKRLEELLLIANGTLQAEPNSIDYQAYSHIRHTLDTHIKYETVFPRHVSYQNTFIESLLHAISNHVFLKDEQPELAECIHTMYHQLKRCHTDFEEYKTPSILITATATNQKSQADRIVFVTAEHFFKKKRLQHAFYPHDEAELNRIADAQRLIPIQTGVYVPKTTNPQSVDRILQHTIQNTPILYSLDLENHIN